MSNIKEDLDSAIKIINRENKYDKFESRIYPFSNEVLTETLKDFNFNNKKCMTVLGSSDQALDMYLRGASNVTAFDINQFTKYYFYLKKAALLSKISIDEYINFFYPYNVWGEFNHNSLNFKTFSKIVQYLSGDYLTFWSTLFERFCPITLSDNFFANDIPNMKCLKDTIGYLNNDAYYKLADMIKDIDIDFNHTNIRDLPSKISQKVDYIYLSNIMQYTREIYSEIKLKAPKDPSKIEQFKKLILTLSEKLNDNGKIMIWNIFNTESIDYRISKDVFMEKCFEFHTFNGLETEEIVLQYTKKTRR